MNEEEEDNGGGEDNGSREDNESGEGEDSGEEIEYEEDKEEKKNKEEKERIKLMRVRSLIDGYLMNSYNENSPFEHSVSAQRDLITFTPKMHEVQSVSVSQLAGLQM
jgi:hypothetical protein